MAVDQVIEEARRAKAGGATRFCMGAAWRSPKERDLDKVCAMVAEVKALGLETCATLGMLTPDQATRLGEAGLDYYNHNLDTSPEHYGAIITTRTYQDRLDTLSNVRAAGLKVCCGGIVGMGESRRQRAGQRQVDIAAPGLVEAVLLERVHVGVLAPQSLDLVQEAHVFLFGLVQPVQPTILRKASSPASAARLSSCHVRPAPSR